ncbi:MAG TPA: hypothetical protein DEW46_07795 [Verrucomicrobia bacterium]|nr:hypothetical protein [Verrucomicrobiota bacterium]
MVTDQPDHCSEIEIEIGIGIDSCPELRVALMDRSNFTAALCQHRIITVAVPGFSCPNPIPRPFDTETDSDPDPDLASPSTLSDDL